MNEQGYERDGGPSESATAVRWWYFRNEADFAFARGGRVATARQARTALAHCNEMYEMELQAWRDRPMFELMKDGSLRPIEYRR